jgi:hypothetical protein
MKVVNIIPNSASGEFSNNGSPSIAVNPSNPNEIVIGVLMGPSGNPTGNPNFPLFVSTDGGNNWTMQNIVPKDDSLSGTDGITVKYGQATNQLYAASMTLPNRTVDVLRTTNPAGGATMSELDLNAYGQPQAWIAAGTVLTRPDAGQDRLYIGSNSSGLGVGRSNSIRQTMNALASPAVFTTVGVDSRPKDPNAFTGAAQNDWPKTIPAVHQDGTVYALFYSWTAASEDDMLHLHATSDVVVVRDDNWGQSAKPYTSLIDSADQMPGQRIVTNVNYTMDLPPAFPSLGQQSLTGDLAIATDPNNSSIVYICWGDDEANHTLHVRRSLDRGQTWSKDMFTVTNATNPGIAINADGGVCLMYQQFNQAGNWETHLRFLIFTPHGRLPFIWDDILLARTPSTGGEYPFQGLYADIMAVGSTFYGAFCAANTPDLTNFPQGVTYLRNANFSNHTLLDVDGFTPVETSLDPFFFSTEFISPIIH